MTTSITYININRHRIQANAKHGENEPPIRISKGKYGRPTYAHEIAIEGPSRLIYDAGKPVLPCGARLAIATESDVRIIR